MSDLIIAILRVIHIGFGAFWVGGTITLGFFIFPMMKASSPGGGQFATQLMARTRLLTVLTVAGLIAIAAGIFLYRGIWAGAGFSGPPRWLRRHSWPWSLRWR